MYLFNDDRFKEPDKSRKEQHMQWELFTSKTRMRLIDQNNKVIITCGYEIPLGEVISEKKKIDLVAYDEDSNIYLIETKYTNGSGTVDKAAKQVSEYAELLENNFCRFLKEFQNGIGDTRQINKSLKKIVLAPKSYYIHKSKPKTEYRNHVLFLTFAKTDEYYNLGSVLGNEGFVDLVEYNWE
jgi:hypothetical protein